MDHRGGPHDSQPLVTPYVLSVLVCNPSRRLTKHSTESPCIFIVLQRKKNFTSETISSRFTSLRQTCIRISWSLLKKLFLAKLHRIALESQIVHKSHSFGRFAHKNRRHCNPESRQHSLHSHVVRFRTGARKWQKFKM